MNNQDKEILAQEVELFLDYLHLKDRPKVYFIVRENVHEINVTTEPQKQVLSFNLWFMERLPLDFVMLVVLHEIYHFAKQGIIDYLHVLEMKYNHLWAFMQLYDIEADLRVAEYLYKQKVIPSFDRYIEILHSGAHVFKNPTIRLVKLERFIGSLVSVKKFFKTGKVRLFLPKLSLNTVMLICIDFEEIHLMHSFFEIPTIELECWKLAFQKADDMNWTDYISFIDKLTDGFI